MDRVVRGDGVALWRKIEGVLAEELRRVPPEGDRRLPTERELASRFGVNRHTVRQAVRALADSGLVRIEQGRGMFAAAPIDYTLGKRTRFSANLLTQERVPGHEILTIELLPASPACAAALGLESLFHLRDPISVVRNDERLECGLCRIVSATRTTAGATRAT